MRFYAGIGAVIGWFALILQLILLLGVDDGMTVAQHTVNFFSYFTILSNILAALMLTVAWSGRRLFFGRPSVQTAITLYMTITGLVYTFILAGLWQPAGWSFVANALLHYVMPVVIVLFWFLFVRKGTLSFATLPWMMVFPIAYAVYSLIRGPMANWYPYPFLDAGALSTGALIVNIVAVTAGFVVVGFIYIWLDRFLGGRAIQRAA